jgi:hypothetical protein
LSQEDARSDFYENQIRRQYLDMSSSKRIDEEMPEDNSDVSRNFNEKPSPSERKQLLNSQNHPLPPELEDVSMSSGKLSITILIR